MLFLKLTSSVDNHKFYLNARFIKEFTDHDGHSRISLIGSDKNPCFEVVEKIDEIATAISDASYLELAVIDVEQNNEKYKHEATE